jgi:DNA-binding beta-propeller fold protein YncE
MKLKTASLLILLITLVTLLSACGGGGGGASATANTSASKQGVVFTLGKSALVSAKTAGKRANALTMDAAAKYASVTVTDASGATVLQDYKTDIYTLNDSYITATIPLPPGNYNLTQFFVLDDSNHILYLVPTQTAADNIKSLVTTLLPIGFSVAKDIANTIAVQIVPVGAGSASDYGYPSVIFDVVNTTNMMISVQTLDATAKNWLLIDAALKLNDTDFALPAQQTSILQVAKADSYTLVVSKSGYITKTVTLTAAEAVKYQSYPLVVVLVKSGVEKYVFDLKWGSEGTGDGQFSSPEGIAVDPISGSIYVIDQRNHRIQKFSSTGAYITQWGSYGAGNGQLSFPSNMAIDASGNVYVADEYNHRIQKFSSTGAYITQWGSFGKGDGQFIYPKGIAVDATGNIYVTEYHNQRVQKFSSTGTFITKWGSAGTGDGQFTNTWGIAFDPTGNVYVGDYDGNRIQKFSLTGVFISKLGSIGSGEGEFLAPTQLAVDQSGNVYVADTGNNRIQKFSPTGTFITEFGSIGTGDGQFHPYGVAVDQTGLVYVADYYNRLQRFHKQ